MKGGISCLGNLCVETVHVDGQDDAMVAIIHKEGFALSHRFTQASTISLNGTGLRQILDSGFWLLFFGEKKTRNIFM
jgi:hypothetical protein